MTFEMEKGVPTEVASHDRSSGVVAGSIDTVDDKTLYRKIDWHIMPLMFLCYLLQFLDKVLINYANIVRTERMIEGFQQSLTLATDGHDNLAQHGRPGF